MDRYNLTNLLWTNLLAYEGHFEAQIQGHLKAAAAYADYYAAYEALWREQLGKSGSPDVDPSAYQRLELKLFRMGQLSAFQCSVHIRCVGSQTRFPGQFGSHPGFKAPETRESVAAFKLACDFQTGGSRTSSG